jgi:hypothetical protein
MGSPIRTVLVGLQAAPAVAAATMYNVVFNTVGGRDLFARTRIPIHNGTVSGDNLTALGSRATDVTLNIPLTLNQAGWWFANAIGAPTTAAVSGATGAFDNTFKVGPATLPPRLTLQLYNGVRWKQVVGASINTMRINPSATEPPSLDLSIIGPAATNIAPPTIPALETVLGARAAGSRELSVTVAAAAAYQRTGSVEFNNNLQRYYTSNNEANVRRLKRGRPEVTLDFNADYEAYTGSFKEDYDLEDDLGEYQAIWLFSDVLIGTGVPVPASIKIVVPESTIDDVDEPDDGPEAEQHVVAVAKYNAAQSTKAYVVLRNENNGYPAD